MPKNNISATIDTLLIEKIEDLRSPKKERRNFSAMVEILIEKGLEYFDEKYKNNENKGNKKK